MARTSAPGCANDFYDRYAEDLSRLLPTRRVAFENHKAEGLKAATNESAKPTSVQSAFCNGISYCELPTLCYAIQIGSSSAASSLFSPSAED